jgi:hypothetical protein
MRTLCGPLLAVACACSGASATQLRGSIHEALAGTSMAPEDTTEAIIEFIREHCPEQLDACGKSSDCLPQIGGSEIPEIAVAKALNACFVKATLFLHDAGRSAELLRLRLLKLLRLALVQELLRRLLQELVLALVRESAVSAWDSTLVEA